MPKSTTKWKSGSPSEEAAAPPDAAATEEKPRIVDLSGLKFEPVWEEALVIADVEPYTPAGTTSDDIDPLSQTVVIEVGDAVDEDVFLNEEEGDLVVDDDSPTTVRVGTKRRHRGGGEPVAKRARLGRKAKRPRASATNPVAGSSPEVEVVRGPVRDVCIPTGRLTPHMWYDWAVHYEPNRPHVRFDFSLGALAQWLLPDDPDEAGTRRVRGIAQHCLVGEHRIPWDGRVVSVTPILFLFVVHISTARTSRVCFFFFESNENF